MDTIINCLVIALFILIAWVPGWILSPPEPGEEFPTERDKMAGAVWLGLLVLTFGTSFLFEGDGKGFTIFYWLFMIPPAVAGMAGRRPFYCGSIVVLTHQALVTVLWVIGVAVGAKSMPLGTLIGLFLFMWVLAMLLCMPLWGLWAYREMQKR